ncbi:MAG: hypothetical protein AB7V55_05935, partial [Oscillospiraceae bacterium]
MMKAFMALLRVNFKNLLLTSANIGSRRKKKAATGISALVIMGALMIYLSGTYSFLLGGALGPVGGLDIMLMIMSVMAIGFPLVMTLFMGQSLLYSPKDIDLVMSLPVSAFSVMLARVLALYLETLMMVELMLIPAGVAWLVYGGSGGVVFMILLIVAGVFLALVPTLVSMVFGCVISLLISKLGKKTLFTTIFSLLLIVAICVLSFSFTGVFGPENALESNAVEAMRQGVAAAIPPAKWLVDALSGPNFVLLL